MHGSHRRSPKTPRPTVPSGAETGAAGPQCEGVAASRPAWLVACKKLSGALSSAVMHVQGTGYEVSVPRFPGLHAGGALILPWGSAVAMALCGARMGRDAGAVKAGLDSRTVGISALGMLLAVALGAAAGRTIGVAAGVLAALAGLVPPAVLAVAMERRSRNVARERRRRELREAFEPPKPTGDKERDT